MIQVIKDFLVEGLNRLRTKSPKFFFILQCIGGGLLMLGLLPWALHRWTPITPSQYLINFCKDVSKVASGFLASALFAVKTPTVAQTVEGEAVKKTDEKKMPFTAREESKAVDHMVPPPPVSNDIPADK